MIFYAHECEEKIGYEFKDKFILRKCFTHTSYANEHNEKSNERLEYLGDAILDFVVADYLFRNAGGDEGDLTKLRAEIVSAKPIGDAIINLGLEKYLLLGEGERNKPVKHNMCSDLFEAVVAGIFLDGGLDNAKKFIYDNLLKSANKSVPDTDWKSRLQEYVQKKKLGRIEYLLANRTGPDHAPEFTFKLSLAGSVIATGVGGSKKQAEQNAAKVAIKKLKTHDNKRGKRN